MGMEGMLHEKEKKRHFVRVSPLAAGKQPLFAAFVVAALSNNILLASPCSSTRIVTLVATSGALIKRHIIMTDNAGGQDVCDNAM